MTTTDLAQGALAAFKQAPMAVVILAIVWIGHLDRKDYLGRMVIEEEALMATAATCHIHSQALADQYVRVAEETTTALREVASLMAVVKDRLSQ